MLPWHVALVWSKAGSGEIHLCLVITTWSRKHLLHKVFSKTVTITSIWKCFLQAFFVKYLSDTVNLEKVNLCYKGGCYQRQIRKQPQTTFFHWVISYCCFVGTPNRLSPCRVSCWEPGCPTPHLRLFCMATLPSQWSLLPWLCRRLFQLCPSQLVLVCSPPATQQMLWGWRLPPDQAVLGNSLKTMHLWVAFPLFNGWRGHLGAPSCFWEESELRIRMSASIINEAIMGSAGLLKTCCWWRCWWQTWHSRAKLCSLMACVLAALGNWQERSL